MKKVKIAFIAILIVSVVGAILAFEAKKFNIVCYYESTVQNQCSFIGVGTVVKEVVTIGPYNTTRLKVVGGCPNQVDLLDCSERHATEQEP